MAELLFDAGSHQIQESRGPVLPIGNYHVQIMDIELNAVGGGEQFHFLLSADGGVFTDKVWVKHSNDDAERIGHNALKRICDYTDNPSIKLTRDIKSWDPLKGKSFYVAIRQELKKGVPQTYPDKTTGEQRPSLQITQYAKEKDKLAPVPDAVDNAMKVEGIGHFSVDSPASPKVNLPSTDDILNRVGGQSKRIDDDVPY